MLIMTEIDTGQDLSESSPPLNTQLELKILGRSKIELRKFGDRNIRIIPEDTEYARKLAEDVLWMPNFFDDGDRVKVGTGMIYVKSYRDPVGGREYDEEMLSDPASRLKTVYRRWSEYPDLPTAIRGMRNIHGEYVLGGHEYEQLRAASSLIRFGIHEVREGGVKNTDDMRALVDLSAERMTSERWDTVVKPDKIEVRDRLMAAMQLADSKDRFNPSRSRLLYNFALLDSIKLFLFEEAAGEKYQNLGDKMVRENHLERFYLEEGRNMLSDLSRARPKSPEYKNRVWGAREYVKRFFSDDVIKANPYKKAGVATRLAIAGVITGNERRDLLELGLSQEEIEALYDGRSFETEPSRVRNILINRCTGLINDALNEGERILRGDEKEPSEMQPNKDIDVRDLFAKL